MRVQGLVLGSVPISGLVLGACVAAMLAAAPNATALDYQKPPQVLSDIVDAPLTPQVRIDPTNTWLALLERPSLPSIAELAERELRLGGMRFNPRVNGPSRTRPYSGLSLLRVADGHTRSIAGLPENARIENVSWSPTGTHVAFTHTSEVGIELWIVDVDEAAARRLTEPKLSLTSRIGPKWLSSGDAIVCTFVPDTRGAEPEAPRVPRGPVTQENTGQSAPARTYQDLLENAHDEALFEHYMSAQIGRVTLDGGITPIGDPALLWDVDPSPDGSYLLVEALHRPFSYLVPAWRFPRRLEVWDAAGALVRQIADLPLQEQVPIAFGSVPTGPRNLAWRADAGATLTWSEALDGGDAGRDAEERDRVFMLAAPFQSDPMPLVTLALRYSQITWGHDELALVHEWWWKTRTLRTWTVRPGEPGAAAVKLFERSWQDRYSAPGDPDMIRNSMGRRVMRTADAGRSIFLIGDGASPEGDRPFLDRLDLETRASERLFHSEPPWFEKPIHILDEAGTLVLTSRESMEEPPNYFVRNLDDGSLRQLTFFPHPTPQLAGIQKELVRYKRADGVELTATLYLPAQYEPSNGPLPLVMWAYPREYKSASDAGQVRKSPHQFDRVGWWSPLLWLTQGYAILDDPTLPIVGEGDAEPNDTFREQLVSSAAAAVDEVVRRGVADPHRIAIGGHSYGAFMTANLLAHSDLFAAGIARSGAYNRTLTPFGFQAEERTLWQAPEIYFRMSPFMHAEKVDEPILLIHGDADNNSGTYPMQSERYYNALKGLGATARLVMLPHESHGYRARESILHMLWETNRWLDTYVKNATPRAGEVEEAAARD